MRLSHHYRTDLTDTSAGIDTPAFDAHLYTDSDPASITDVEDAYYILEFDEADEPVGRYSLTLDNRTQVSNDLALLEAVLGVWLLDGEIDSVDRLPEGFAKGHTLGYLVMISDGVGGKKIPFGVNLNGIPQLHASRSAALLLAGSTALSAFHVEVLPARIDPDRRIHYPRRG